MSDPVSTHQPSPLNAFLPPTRTWFENTLGQPTPPQAQGWPAIQNGEHTLILAPTGSGKTLAAFLWGIDQLYRELTQQGHEPTCNKKKAKPQTRLLYISPLKALNNDVERNLHVPLAGIRHTAEEIDFNYPEPKVSVRSGDTPQRERQAMLRTPPHILITTPESLYLMLTSPNARELFRTVQTVIVDEIHTLAGSKRGVHLSLSLERLQQIAVQPIQRIGLSATIRPLDEVARYLGGNEWQDSGRERVLRPRPVTVVDAGYQKDLDLQVETVVEDFHNLPGDSIWPSIIPRTVELINQHTTTLIFVNNRRSAERTADRLNEQIAAEARGQEFGLIEEGVAKGMGMMAGIGSQMPPGHEPIRAHHGSMSKEKRLTLENELKSGRLPALVGTSSLELGIDIGAVDLVVQLQSPKTVAQGLQRVGRSGHLVGQTSRGRIFPTHGEDVMEAAAVAGGMLRGEVEPTHTPRNPLDILAQQVVAMVSVENRSVESLYDLVRCAYAYQDLTTRSFHAVLEMLSGRYPSVAHRNLRARLVWDRVNNQLEALPGSRLLALTNGGSITDRGSFSAYLSDGKTKLGELDEEFVYETRVGDTLMLGSQVWRVIDLTDDKVVVADAAGATPRMPFWRGDFAWRPYELGRRVGAFRREMAERLQRIRADLALEKCSTILDHREEASVHSLLDWLGQDYALDINSALQAIDYVASQLDHTGVISSDRTVLVEVFDDAVGDPRLVLQTPFGGRVNGLWGLVLAGALRERMGVNVEVQTNDDGVLLRFPEADMEFPLDLITEITPAQAREYVLQELPNSAVFGAQFRQNAARALLLPGASGGKRTPFWLQRLRAKDLLQIVRQFEDFPIVAETYRDCLEEVMDLPHLEEVLMGIQQGKIQVVAFESLNPSPVAQSLMWNFIEFYMYEWDAPKAERQLQTLTANRGLLQDLLTDIDLSELLRPEAVASVRDRLQHTAPTAQARTLEELALLFQNLGDLSSAEVAMRTSADPAGWIGQLAGSERIIALSIPTGQGDAERWVHAEYVPEYITAFELETNYAKDVESLSPDEAQQRILERYLNQMGPVTIETILARYGFPAEWLQHELECRVESRELVHGRFTPVHIPADGSIPSDSDSPTADEFVDRRTLEQMHRRTLTLLRQEVQPVLFTVYADFLTRWQHLHPAERLTGTGALRQILQQLRATPVVGRIWERDILPLRLQNFDPNELTGLCQSGELVWVGSGGVDPRRSRIRFFFRGEGRAYLEDAPDDLSTCSDDAQAIYDFLKSEGAAFGTDIQAALELTPQAVETGLIELFMAGLVTNDSLATLWRIIQQPKRQTANISSPKPVSSLEVQLAQRIGSRPQRPGTLGSLRRPSRSEFQIAKRRVRERMIQRTESASSPIQSDGRWTLVHRFGILGKALPQTEIVTRQTRQLLARYGVVTRESLTREIGAWEWATIYQELQRLEIRGEIRRGIFVQGLPGLQFALPEVVERLRELMNVERELVEVNHVAPVANGGTHLDRGEALIVINACDPANVYGPAMQDGPLSFDGKPLTFARVPSTWLVQNRGLPVLLIEDSGSHMTMVQGVNEGLIRRALQTWLHHLSSFAQRVMVQSWNGASVLESAGQPLLESVGFHRDYPGMTWQQ